MLQRRSNLSGTAPSTYSTLWGIVFISEVSHFQHGKCFHVFRAMSVQIVAFCIVIHHLLGRYQCFVKYAASIFRVGVIRVQPASHSNHFNHEDGGSTFLQNTDIHLQHCMVSQLSQSFNC
jgi:hypothetical protein